MTTIERDKEEEKDNAACDAILKMKTGYIEAAEKLIAKRANQQNQIRKFQQFSARNQCSECGAEQT